MSFGVCGLLDNNVLYCIIIFNAVGPRGLAETVDEPGVYYRAEEFAEALREPVRNQRNDTKYEKNKIKLR